jgi:hypothetical protein
MIHGGELGAGGRLRPTHGCIRLSDADLAALIAGLETIATAGNAPVCSIQRINVTVTMGDTDAGEDDGDPLPPYIDQILNGTGPDPIIWHP